ncbi:MAG: sigma-70 family RNA polymerase sigma factor [Chloroflexota bacterium]
MSELRTVVEAAQQGDLSAFGEIVNRFQDMAFAIGYDRLGNVQQAEDVAQEAFFESYKNLHNLQEAAAFPGWFRTIVQRQCNRVTRRKELTKVPLDNVGALPDNNQDLPAMVQKSEMRRQVHAIIQSMPDREREVTLLYYLADYSQQEIADFLDLRASTVKSRLHTARKFLRERMIDMAPEKLQEQRLSTNQTFTNRVMDIIEATENNDLAKMEELLKREPELAKTRNATGRTLLHLITEYPANKPNCGPMIRLLLDAGLDPNIRFEGANCETALHWAASANDVEAIDALLDGGADIDIDGAVISYGTPLTDAVFFRQPKAIQRLVERGATVNLPLAAGMGDVNRVQQFFTDSGELKQSASELRYNPESHGNILTQDEATGLLEEAFAYACLAGHIGVAQFLLRRGVDINSMPMDEHSKRTGLHWAVSNNHAEMVRFLIEQGADLTIQDEVYQSTPLGWAKHQELKEMEEMLTDVGTV